MPPLHGQNQPTSVDAVPIATDRPAVTNFSVVVPTGSLQAENGFLETSSQGQTFLDGPESLVRFGVAKRTELRFMVPDYFYNLNTGDHSGSGFGDFAVGVKEQLGPVAAARLALLELASTAREREDSRRYFAKPGEAEWGC